MTVTRTALRIDQAQQSRGYAGRRLSAVLFTVEIADSRSAIPVALAQIAVPPWLFGKTLLLLLVPAEITISAHVAVDAVRLLRARRRKRTRLFLAFAVGAESPDALPVVRAVRTGCPCRNVRRRLRWGGICPSICRSSYFEDSCRLNGTCRVSSIYPFQLQVQGRDSFRDSFRVEV